MTTQPASGPRLLRAMVGSFRRPDVRNRLEPQILMLNYEGFIR